MTRFRKAVEEWRKLGTDKIFPWPLKPVAETYTVQPTTTILLDVTKAVDAYERTIADLKRQNGKLRRKAK